MQLLTPEPFSSGDEKMPAKQPQQRDDPADGILLPKYPFAHIDLATCMNSMAFQTKYIGTFME